jgi:hypothetical protein
MASVAGSFRSNHIHAARRPKYLSKYSWRLEGLADRRRACGDAWGGPERDPEPEYKPCGRQDRSTCIRCADSGRLEGGCRSSADQVAVAAFIPWAATLGSSNPVHQQLPFFFGLWIAIAFAALVISVQTGRAAVTATSVMALCLIFLDINFGLSSPFRLASPLAMQNVPTQTGWGSELKLDRKTNVFIRGLRDAARQGGFCQGCLAIDLTGVMPGAVFVMDGRMPIFPWLFSSHLAQEYLKRLGPERLAKSWLITGAREALSIQQENELGITFQRYRLIAELHHPLDDSPVRVYAPNAPAD